MIALWVAVLVYTCCGSQLLFSDLSIFFFQAEDGIRDLTVTGVQTCALPISLLSVPHVDQVHVFYRARLLDCDFAPGEETLEVGLFEEIGRASCRERV